MTRIPSLRAQRAALVEACLPAPSSRLPGLSTLDLSGFWQRFDDAAPAHLRAGMMAATVAFAALAPVSLRRATRLEQLAPEEWERLFHVASRLPLFDDLIMLTKVVACLAYFDDDDVQDAVREEVTS
ncbi:MAG: hypothetical protein GXP55_00660 [Deltaproteobacteria bacterium]|nr:hypothetical protein [Deltaproteobacteria bacterium]